MPGQPPSQDEHPAVVAVTQVLEGSVVQAEEDLGSQYSQAGFAGFTAPLGYSMPSITQPTATHQPAWQKRPAQHWGLPLLHSVSSGTQQVPS